MKILVTEDEEILAESLKTLLESNGYEVDLAFDGNEGWDYASLNLYDLIVMDVMMPGMDGYQLTQKIRSNHIGTPILMLTARSSLDDRVEGLNAGADYYLTKPFETRELLACVRTLLRRQGTQVDEITYGNTVLDLSSATLRCGSQTLRLSAKEFDVMRLLLQSKDRNLSKELILNRVWGFDSNAVENHVEVYIGFLRKKLAGIGSNIRIVSVRRQGYHLEETDQC